jgi:phage tail-like protein
VTSDYLAYLPAVFAEDPFLADFLSAFEAVLVGAPDVQQPGLEAEIARIGEHFDPMTAPRDFLPWLAGWVALSVRADWDEDITRGFIREIVPLYARRGTAEGLRRMLKIFLNPTTTTLSADDVVIIDTFDEPAHFFQVRLTLSDNDPARLRAVQEMARAIVDREKPAHTFYALKVVIPTMRLVSVDLQKAEEGRSELLVLGRNTWLGTAE